MRKRQGFTIIEVVLVLAIAGLIFLMVFVALPSLQRNQRNLQRQRDLQRISTAVTKYVANNNKLPFTYSGDNRVDANFIPRYVDSSCKYGGRLEPSAWGDQYYSYTDCSEEFRDPDGTTYVLVVLNGNSGGLDINSNSEVTHKIYVAAGAACGTAEGTRYATNKAKTFALFIRLDGGAIYCIDNNDV